MIFVFIHHLQFSNLRMTKVWSKHCSYYYLLFLLIFGIFEIPSQVGDGTTTVTLLASEFLKQVKPFIEEGVHAQVAVKSFRKAANLVRD